MQPDEDYQEALKRIKEAASTGAKELNLSGLGLSELPPEIGGLAKLTWLNLFYNQLTALPTEIEGLASLQSSRN